MKRSRRRNRVLLGWFLCASAPGLALPARAEPTGPTTAAPGPTHGATGKPAAAATSASEPAREAAPAAVSASALPPALPSASTPASATAQDAAQTTPDPTAGDRTALINQDVLQHPPQTAIASRDPSHLQTTKMKLGGLLDRSVHSLENNEVGRVIDVMTGDDGKPAALELDVGGFLGVGNRRIAVAWRLFDLSRTGQNDPLRVALSAAQVRSAPAMDDNGEMPVVTGAAPIGPAPGKTEPAAAPSTAPNAPAASSVTAPATPAPVVPAKPDAASHPAAQPMDRAKETGPRPGHTLERTSEPAHAPAEAKPQPPSPDKSTTVRPAPAHHDETPTPRSEDGGREQRF